MTPMQVDSSHLTSLFENATEGIILTNGKGVIVLINPAIERMFGYSPEDLVGNPIETLVPAAVKPNHSKLREHFYHHPQNRVMGHGRDLHVKRRDGSLFPAEISLSYFYRENELYVVAYIIDTTYKKEAEQVLIEQKNRIEQLNAELEQKVADRTNALMVTLHQLELSKDELSKALTTERELGELKSRFVSMASHEFRTPLSAIQTSADLLNKYTTTEQQDKRYRHIHRIKASVNH
ncbi:MAG: PAS domain S-box protein, partial [Chitinophagaceae bacterium]